MSIKMELGKIGFSVDEARRLSINEDFHHKRKTADELRSLIEEIANRYECSIAVVKSAVLTFPLFASYDHARVLRQKMRLGRIVKLSQQETLKMLITHPVFAGYAAKRYLAALDVGRTLKEEGFPQDKEMLRIFFNNISRSPYVPGTRRRRISQATGVYTDPPLLKEMRRRLQKI